MCNYTGHRGCVYDVSITTSSSDPENENDLDFLIIASGDADRTVRLWDYASGSVETEVAFIVCGQ